MVKGYCKELEQSGISSEAAKTIIVTFLYYYLSPEQYSISACIDFVETFLEKTRRDLLKEYELAKSRLKDMFK